MKLRDYLRFKKITNKTDVLALFIFERVFGIIALLILIFSVFISYFYTFLGILFLILIIIFFKNFINNFSFIKRIPYINFINFRINNHFKLIKKEQILIISILIQIIFYLQILAIYFVITDGQIYFKDILIFCSFIIIFNSIPFFFSGIGIRELGVIIFIFFFDHEIEPLLNVTLLIGINNIVVSVIFLFGLITYFHLYEKKGFLKLLFFKGN